MSAFSRYDTPALDDLPDDIRCQVEAVQEKSGFIPNVFLVLARRPEEFRAFYAYHDALMMREGDLSVAEKEMIVVATSAAQRIVAKLDFLQRRVRCKSCSCEL